LESDLATIPAGTPSATRTVELNQLLTEGSQTMKCLKNKPKGEPAVENARVAQLMLPLSWREKSVCGVLINALTRQVQYQRTHRNQNGVIEVSLR